MSVLDSEQKLEAAANLAEPAATIIDLFTNNAVGDDPIVTRAGVIPSLADLIKEILDRGVVASPTQVYDTIAEGISNTADFQIFIVQDPTSMTYGVYENIDDNVYTIGTISNQDFTQALLNKLNSIQTSATQNQTDSYLVARGNHTGTQPTSTIVGLDTSINNLNTSVTNLNTNKAAKGANADITSLSGLTTPLSLTQGGTGTTTGVATMGPATTTVAGTKGLVPAPNAGDNTKFLNGAGTFSIPSPSQVGDLLETTRTPDATYLPAQRAVYSQATYPDLYAVLGTLPDMYKTTQVTSTLVISGTTYDMVYTLCYGNGVVVASISQASVGSVYLVRSTNGTLWTIGLQVNAQNIVFFKGLFFAFSSSSASTYYTSPDGITWTTRTGPWSAVIPKIGTGSNSNILIVSASFDGANTYYTSTDGITWTTRPAITGLPTGVGTFTLTSVNDQFLLALNNNTTRAYSADGTTWALITSSSQIDTGGNSLANGIVYCNGTYYAGVIYSSQGYYVGIYSAPSLDSKIWSRVSYQVAYGDSNAVFTTTFFPTSNFVVGQTICFFGSSYGIISHDGGISWQLLPGQPTTNYGTTNVVAFNKVIIGAQPQGNQPALYNWPLYSYDNTTQFITPHLRNRGIAKTYIKAKLS